MLKYFGTHKYLYTNKVFCIQKYSIPICARFDEIELKYIDKIVKENGFRNRSEYVKFACIYAGGIAKNIHKLRRWLHENDITDD